MYVTVDVYEKGTNNDKATPVKNISVTPVKGGLEKTIADAMGIVRESYPDDEHDYHVRITNTQV